LFCFLLPCGFRHDEKKNDSQKNHPFLIDVFLLAGGRCDFIILSLLYMFNYTSFIISFLLWWREEKSKQKTKTFSVFWFSQKSHNH
jgi:hypothetical protein